MKYLFKIRKSLFSAFLLLTLATSSSHAMIFNIHSGYIAEELYSWLHSDGYWVKNLPIYQKACLAMCLAANTMSYSDSTDRMILNGIKFPFYTNWLEQMNQTDGVCYNFASVSAGLLAEMGAIESTHSSSNYYSQFQIEKKWNHHRLLINIGNGIWVAGDPTPTKRSELVYVPGIQDPQCHLLDAQADTKIYHSLNESLNIQFYKREQLEWLRRGYEAPRTWLRNYAINPCVNMLHNHRIIYDYADPNNYNPYPYNYSTRISNPYPGCYSELQMNLGLHPFSPLLLLK